MLAARSPSLLKRVTFDPEASELVVTSEDDGALERLERWLRKLQTDPALLRRGLRRVDRSLIFG